MTPDHSRSTAAPIMTAHEVAHHIGQAREALLTADPSGARRHLLAALDTLKDAERHAEGAALPFGYATVFGFMERYVPNVADAVAEMRPDGSDDAAVYEKATAAGAKPVRVPASVRLVEAGAPAETWAFPIEYVRDHFERGNEPVM